MDEARDNLKDAIALMLEPMDLSGAAKIEKRLVHETLVL